MVSDKKAGVQKGRGSARGDVCIKRGFIKLKSHAGVVGIYPTNCKSWRCVSCQRKKKSLIVDRIEYGAKQISQQLFFITLTFATEGLSRRNADSVERAYRRWCASMRSSYPNLTWFKTVEWTKRSQAHLHLIAGGIPARRKLEWTCTSGRKTRGKLLALPCVKKPECLDHKLSEMWLSATKDSYIVYCTGVVGPRGIANYISKYVTKEMSTWRGMRAAGFKRRWSCSRNWPRYEKLELTATRGEGWAEVAYKKHNLESQGEKEFYPDGVPETGAFERVGSDRAKVFAVLKQKRMVAAMAKRMKKNAGKYETDGAIYGSRQRG